MLLSASSNSALRSSFHSSRRSSPCSTTSPSVTYKLAICPPICGASIARRQATTVPARVLATEDLTSLRSTSATVTFSGPGRDKTTKTNTRATTGAIHKSRLKPLCMQFPFRSLSDLGLFYCGGWKSMPRSRSNHCRLRAKVINENRWSPLAFEYFFAHSNAKTWKNITENRGRY
ncbi:hypothetical protein MnTg04_00407 [bacterium MnTg04]|nr:hypothetical protein MnTg04_00407 [bacterium MnTg04]